jgi:hypothetical protein
MSDRVHSAQKGARQVTYEDIVEELEDGVSLPDALAGYGLTLEEWRAVEANAAAEPSDKIVQFPQVEQQKPFPGRTTIFVEGGSLSVNVREAEFALARATGRDPAEGIYQRSNGLAKIARLAKPSNEQGIERPAQTLHIELASPPYLRYRLGDVAMWLTKNAEGNVIRIDPPMAVASTVHALGTWPNTPPLTGIVEAPTMRPNGSILDTPGYDAATGLYFDPGAIEFAPVPERPTKKEAARALALLLDTISEFPFVSEAARSVLVSCMITPSMRPAVKTAPLFAFDAPTPGTGKGLATRLPAMIVTGRDPSMLSNWADSAEDTRRMLAVMLEALPVVVIDNVNDVLKSNSLCTILTEGQIRDRVIKSSTTATGSARLTWIATGNNIVIGGDLPRRTLVCRMDAKVEKPESRTFKREQALEDYVRENRAEFAVACLTLIRAYQVADKRVKVKAFGSFEDWSQVAREPLVWLGLADPLETQGTINQRDPDLEAMKAILSAWDAAWADKTLKLNEAVEDAAVAETMRAYAETDAGKPNLRSVGWLFGRHVGRVFDNLRVDAGKVKQSTATWRVTVAR